MSVVLTILSAVIIFLLSQFVLRIIIEPIIELRKAMGLISYTLLYYRSKLTNAAANNNISDEVKKCSSKLLSTYSTIPFYNYLYKIFHLPSYKDLIEASKNLNLIRSYMIEGHIDYLKSTNPESKISFPLEISNSIDEIARKLNICTSYQEISSEQDKSEKK